MHNVNAHTVKGHNGAVGGPVVIACLLEGGQGVVNPQEAVNPRGHATVLVTRAVREPGVAVAAVGTPSPGVAIAEEVVFVD